MNVRIPYFADITSGDFYLADEQTVGYPGFVYLESFISQPLAKVEAAGATAVTFRSTNGTGELYVDGESGFIYAYQSSKQTLAELCGEDGGCSVQVVASLPGKFLHTYMYYSVSQKTGSDVKSIYCFVTMKASCSNTQFDDIRSTLLCSGRVDISATLPLLP